MIQNQNQGRGRREEDEQNDAPNCYNMEELKVKGER